MDPVSRKKTILIAVLVLVILAPLLLFSNWGMAMIENLACRSAPKEWAASLQLKCAQIYGVSLRSKKQLQALSRFLDTFPKHPRRGYARYMIAVCLERDLEVSGDVTIQAYGDFLDEFGDDPNSREYVPEAEQAIRRLENR